MERDGIRRRIGSGKAPAAGRAALLRRSVTALLGMGGAIAAAAAPAAHAPRYSDERFWTAEQRKGAFVKETWPERRLLVWGTPGKTIRGQDVLDPANWLENGKPADKPIDENTDLLLPDSGGPYRAMNPTGSQLICRHLTVGRNAWLNLVRFAGYGNIWVREGGGMWWDGGLKGDKHTFVRNDNLLRPKSAPPVSRYIGDRTLIRTGNHLGIAKAPGVSVEFVGNFETGDDLNIAAGTMVVGPDSSFCPGDRSVQGIYPKARLVLLSGARFHKRGNQHYGVDILVAGELVAGTEERPLTRDCFLGISYKARDPDDLMDSVVKRGRLREVRGSPRYYGLVVLPEGAIRTHSADPGKARLVLGWHRQPRVSRWGGDGTHLVRKIDTVFLGEAQINGIEFNDIRKGGILLPSPAARCRWEHVFYGEGNEGEAEELYGTFEGSTEFKLKG